VSSLISSVSSDFRNLGMVLANREMKKKQRKIRPLKMCGKIPEEI
jgi:hypothetical protein